MNRSGLMYCFFGPPARRRLLFGRGEKDFFPPKWALFRMNTFLVFHLVVMNDKSMYPVFIR